MAAAKRRPVANADEKSRAILIVQKRDAFLHPVFDGVWKSGFITF
jgi:hypothetical protein